MAARQTLERTYQRSGRPNQCAEAFRVALPLVPVFHDPVDVRKKELFSPAGFVFPCTQVHAQQR